MVVSSQRFLGFSIGKNRSKHPPPKKSNYPREGLESNVPRPPYHKALGRDPSWLAILAKTLWATAPGPARAIVDTGPSYTVHSCHVTDAGRLLGSCALRSLSSRGSAGKAGVFWANRAVPCTPAWGRVLCGHGLPCSAFH